MKAYSGRGEAWRIAMRTQNVYADSLDCVIEHGQQIGDVLRFAIAHPEVGVNLSRLYDSHAELLTLLKALKDDLEEKAGAAGGQA